MDEKMGSLPIDEQETTISYCRGEQTVNVWTSDKTVMTKLDRRCRESPGNYKIIDIGKDPEGGIVSKEYEISDKKLLSFRSAKMVVELTEEQRTERAERMRTLRMRK